jgi:histidine triad (HIT) family protein
MENCVFCKIVKGEIPATKLYEDELTLSFLDINPASKGHSLVIPKKHYPTMLDIPEMELAELIKAVQKIGAAAMKATKADGFNIIQNNKEAAGQVVQHLHFHVVPRFKNDGLKLSFGSKLADFNELQKWEKEYKKHL